MVENYCLPTTILSRDVGGGREVSRIDPNDAIASAINMPRVNLTTFSAYDCSSSVFCEQFTTVEKAPIRCCAAFSS
jgi:hypothetical protein